MANTTVELWTDDVMRELDKQVRGLKIEVFNHVTRNTRVRFGLLMGNWQTSNGTPIDGTRDLTDPSGSVVSSEIQATVTGIDDTSWLTNNLPYAAKWNEVDGYIDSAVALFSQKTKILRKR